MPVTRLDNAAWGFGSSCFVCEPGNPAGLHLEFFHDDEGGGPGAGAVTATFTLGAAFSGPPRYVHGGLVLAVLDEAMAWGAIALAGRFALTRACQARFLRPVALDAPHRVEARLAGAPAGDTVALSGVVADAGGRACVTASAEFAVMSPAVADAAIGPRPGDDAGFVRA